MQLKPLILIKVEEDGIKGWNGKAKWYESTITGILTNEKYKGDAFASKDLYS